MAVANITAGNVSAGFKQPLKVCNSYKEVVKMTCVIKDELMASFRDLAVDNVMTIAIQDDCAVCCQEIKNRLLFENAVEQLARAWHQIVARHGLFVEHAKVCQGDSIIIRFGRAAAGVAPLAPNQQH